MLMYIAFGWVLASLGLYYYLVKTAEEVPFSECMDCMLSGCKECNAAKTELKIAA